MSAGSFTAGVAPVVIAFAPPREGAVGAPLGFEGLLDVSSLRADLARSFRAVRCEAQKLCRSLTALFEACC